MQTNNNTDNILRNINQLNDEPDYNDFEHRQHFNLLCKLVPNPDRERVDILPIGQDLINKPGLVYIFVINNKIFKIGNTTNNIKERIQSYNCGKKAYRERGTCSVTNYYVLQSILSLNVEVDVYAFFPEEPKYTLFGVVYTDPVAPAKKAENILINFFKEQYGKIPMGCTQK